MPVHLNIGKTAWVLGLVLAGYHLVWSALVALGWAQPVLDFIFWAHFLKPVYVVEPFEPARVPILLALTGVIGMMIGAFFAWVWNRLHRT
jgi:hypothetical protein